MANLEQYGRLAPARCSPDWNVLWPTFANVKETRSVLNLVFKIFWTNIISIIAFYKSWQYPFIRTPMQNALLQMLFETPSENMKRVVYKIPLPQRQNSIISLRSLLSIQWNISLSVRMVFYTLPQYPFQLIPYWLVNTSAPIPTNIIARGPASRGMFLPTNFVRDAF